MHGKFVPLARSLAMAQSSPAPRSPYSQRSGSPRRLPCNAHAYFRLAQIDFPRIINETKQHCLDILPRFISRLLPCFRVACSLLCNSFRCSASRRSVVVGDSSPAATSKFVFNILSYFVASDKGFQNKRLPQKKFGRKMGHNMARKTDSESEDDDHGRREWPNSRQTAAQRGEARCALSRPPLSVICPKFLSFCSAVLFCSPLLLPSQNCAVNP